MSATSLFALVLAVVVVACTAMPYPQKDGALYSKEAIRQAQNTLLIPQNSDIEKVQEGIEIGAYEKIPGNQKINLYEILGDQFPPEVILNLQGQIDKVGRQ